MIELFEAHEITKNNEEVFQYLDNDGNPHKVILVDANEYEISFDEPIENSNETISEFFNEVIKDIATFYSALSEFITLGIFPAIKGTIIHIVKAIVVFFLIITSPIWIFFYKDYF